MWESSIQWMHGHTVYFSLCYAKPERRPCVITEQLFWVHAGPHESDALTSSRRWCQTCPPVCRCRTLSHADHRSQPWCPDRLVFREQRSQGDGEGKKKKTSSLIKMLIDNLNPHRHVSQERAAVQLYFYLLWLKVLVLNSSLRIPPAAELKPGHRRK